MAKTIRQIADELGVSKQRVYRFIKQNCINEAHQRNGVMYYDDAAETRIKQGFLKNELLREELNRKNEQIQQLNERLADTTAALVAAQQTIQTVQQTTQTAQALHAGTIQQQLITDEGEDNQQHTGLHRWFRRFFRE